MKSSLNGANIIILAENHNPSIASREWLRDKDIITEQMVNFTNTPIFSLFETPNFILIIDEKRLSLSVKVVNQSNVKSLPTIAQRYVQSLPETPYTAIGLNFSWIAEAIGNENGTDLLRNFYELGKREFFRSLSGNYHIGGIIYFESNIFLVKVTFEPNLQKDKDILLSFNFHCDLKRNKGKNTEKLINAISEYEENLEFSGKIANDLLRG